MKSAVWKTLNRRRALTLIGGAGVIAVNRGHAQTASCVSAAPAMTEGPYWVDEKLFRSDIRTDPATGVARPGVPLNLTINVQNLASGCATLAGALVYIWHCDAIGIYSDESAYNPGGGTGTVVTTGQKFLRGYQITDDSGQVRFLTIYPGWYMGRTIHIHVRVRTYSGSTILDNFTTQLFFDDSTSNAVLAQAPYNTRTTVRDTVNSNDMVYNGAAAAASRMLLALTQTSTGYDGVATIAVNLKTPAAGTPAIASGGAGNAASGAAGIAPGAWTSIYGSNLASATRTLGATDVVNNQLPTSLGGVSVQIDGKAAYPYYVSPTQLNVLAPADTAAGQVAVSVSTSAGASAAVSATLQPILPGLFTVSNYVRIASAKAGEAIELYGNGFGPTQTPVDSGAVFTGAYELANPVSVTIGGIQAEVLFAGLVGPGLNQINVVVPVGLAGGDYPVAATIAGLSTQSAALLKIAS
jgi:uncharacterized protein (TIGR03437 family)